MAKVKTGPKVKRKGGGVPAKAKRVGELAEGLSTSPAIVVTEYRGLTVQELQDLRRKLRPRGIDYRVVKNTLFARAADASGRAAMRPLLVGPTAIAVPTAGYTVDEVELARSVVDEMRTFKALRIVGAFIGDRAYGPDQVTALSRLPSRRALQATIVGTLQAPLSTVIRTLGAPLANIVRVLAARGSTA